MINLCYIVDIFLLRYAKCRDKEYLSHMFRFSVFHKKRKEKKTFPVKFFFSVFMYEYEQKVKKAIFKFPSMAFKDQISENILIYVASSRFQPSF